MSKARITLKSILNLICKIIVLPLALICKLEEIFGRKDSEVVFQLCGDAVALLPGLPGAFLRRAFYVMTLDHCSSHCHIGFGTVFAHRCSTIADYVYIGRYALIGSAHIGERTLIGSRVSIISSNALHELDDNNQWTAFSADKIATVSISRDVWIGEGAIIAANIGEVCVIGSGAVITTDVKPYVMMSGNPARFIKKLGKDNAE